MGRGFSPLLSQAIIWFGLNFELRPNLILLRVKLEYFAIKCEHRWFNIFGAFLKCFDKHECRFIVSMPCVRSCVLEAPTPKTYFLSGFSVV